MNIIFESDSNIRLGEGSMCTLVCAQYSACQSCPLKQKNWEMDDDFAFRNEFKLIDDSYYRVYDDPDYEVWKERVLSLVVISRSYNLAAFIYIL